MNKRTVARRAGSFVISSIFLFLLLLWLPMISVVAHEKTPSIYRGVTKSVQGTPTADPTMTALEKEQLAQEIDLLKNQNRWTWTNVSTLLTVLVALIVGILGFWRWREDQRIDKEKRAEDQRIEQIKRDEERFQNVVSQLGSRDIETRVGVAITLRTFLHQGYEQFYSQVFDLVVAHLRLRKVDPNTPSDPKISNRVISEFDSFSRDKMHITPNTPVFPDSLSQALIMVFKESFPLARERLKQPNFKFSPQLLDARAIQLDKAYLRGCDLKEAWMPNASLLEADLKSSELTEANLEGANLTRASLNTAVLTRANLSGVTFANAILEWADLSGSVLDSANLTEANLTGANLTGASLSEINLANADLTDANLTNVDLSGANPEAAKSLLNTKMFGVTGLTKEQYKACLAKEAIVADISEDTDQLSIPNTS